MAENIQLINYVHKLFISCFIALKHDFHIDWVTDRLKYVKRDVYSKQKIAK